MAFGVELGGSSLIATGNGVAASATDGTATTTGFQHISIKNDDATNSITFTVDEVSTGTPSKPIVVKAGESFDDYISGNVLHYSAASGSPTFRYVLR